MPNSLRGTDIDGDFTLDVQGYFVADRYAVRVFDYFLTAEGEEELSRIRERILDFARRRLSDEQVVEVAQLFDEYLRYRADVAERLGTLSVGDFRGGYEAMREAQLVRWDADTAERLFGVDNRSALSAIEQAEHSAWTY